MNAPPIVIFVTDPRESAARTSRVIQAAAIALGSGRLLVQLRDKECGPDALLRTARGLRAVTRECGALFVVNGATSVAKDVGADGVHLPSGDADRWGSRIFDVRRALGQGAFVTAAAHDDDEVRAAAKAGSTAVLVSPIFASPGKGRPRGVAAIASSKTIVKAAPTTSGCSIYALGGVTATNAAACAAAGASGVAVIRALYESADPRATVLALASPFFTG